MTIIIGILLLFGLLLPGTIRASVSIDVPFVPQAPFGNWAQPWQDFCEEATVVMAAHFIWGYPLSAKLADFQMRAIKMFEETVFRKYRDTSIDETSLILTALYRFRANVSVREISSLEEIKQEIQAGKILIVPLAGREIKNPFFRLPGPLYHMVIVRGFDDDAGTFVTNDPGTSRGDGLAYPQKRFYGAIHDWNNGDVLNGKKRVIVISR